MLATLIVCIAVLIIPLVFFFLQNDIALAAIPSANKRGINLAGRWEVAQAVPYVGQGGWIMLLGTNGQIGDLQEQLDRAPEANFIWRPWKNGEVFTEEDAIAVTASLGCICSRYNPPRKIYLMPWNEPNLPRECKTGGSTTICALEDFGGTSGCKESTEEELNTDCVPLVREYITYLKDHLQSAGLWNGPNMASNCVEILTPMINPSAPNSNAFYSELGVGGFYDDFSGIAIAPYDFERNVGPLGRCDGGAGDPFCAVGYDTFLTYNGIPFGPNQPVFAVEVGVVDEDAAHPEVPDYPIFEPAQMNTMMRAAWSIGDLVLNRTWGADTSFAMFSPLSYNPENHDSDWIWNSDTLNLYVNEIDRAGTVLTGGIDLSAYNSWLAQQSLQDCSPGRCAFAPDSFCGPQGSVSPESFYYPTIEKEFCEGNVSPLIGGKYLPPVEDPDCPGVEVNPFFNHNYFGPLVITHSGIHEPPTTPSGACLTLQKISTPSCIDSNNADVGDTVTVTYQITALNSCNRDIEIISISDPDSPSPLTCGSGTPPVLASGSSCTNTYTRDIIYQGDYTTTQNTVTLNINDPLLPSTLTSTAHIIHAPYSPPASETLSCNELYQCPINVNNGSFLTGHGSDIFYGVHHGWDFVAPAGTPIYAAHGGTVTLAGWNGGYGYTIRIAGFDGRMYVYGHMHPDSLHSLGTVTTGEQIGNVGPECLNYTTDMDQCWNAGDSCSPPTTCTNGASTGPHLHFEIRESPFCYNQSCVNCSYGCLANACASDSDDCTINPTAIVGCGPGASTPGVSEGGDCDEAGSPTIDALSGLVNPFLQDYQHAVYTISGLTGQNIPWEALAGLHFLESNFADMDSQTQHNPYQISFGGTNDHWISCAYDAEYPWLGQDTSQTTANCDPASSNYADSKCSDNGDIPYLPCYDGGHDGDDGYSPPGDEEAALGAGLFLYEYKMVGGSNSVRTVCLPASSNLDSIRCLMAAIYGYNGMPNECAGPAYGDPDTCSNINNLYYGNSASGSTQSNYTVNNYDSCHCGMSINSDHGTCSGTWSIFYRKGAFTVSQILAQGTVSGGIWTCNGICADNLPVIPQTPADW